MPSFSFTRRQRDSLDLNQIIFRTGLVDICISHDDNDDSRWNAGFIAGTPIHEEWMEGS
jgi:hypothetical protein